MAKNLDLISKFFPDGWRSRNVIYAAGGLVCIGLGGYVFYKKVVHRDQRTKSPPDNSTAKTGNASKEKPAVAKDVAMSKCMKLKNDGNDHFRNSRYQDAIKCYTEAINLCPKTQKLDMATFYQNRAAAFEKIDDYENVIADCTEALKLNKKYTKAIRRRADAAEKMQMYQVALQDFVKLCILEDFQNQAVNACTDRVLCLLAEHLAKDYLAKRGDQPVPLSVSFVTDTLSFYTADPIINSVHSNGVGIQNGLTEDQDEQLTGFKKAKASLINQQFHRIIPACTEEIEREDSQFLVESLLLRGTFYIFVADYSKALKDLNRVLEELKNVPYDDEFKNSLKCNAYLKLALMHQLVENYPGCAEALTEAERINPNNPDIFSQKGQMHLAMNDTSQALEDFEKAVALKPDCPFYNIQRTMSEFKSAFLREDEMTIRRCVDDLEQLAERFPDCAEAQATYGFMLTEMMQQFLKATEYLEKALKLAPTNATILVRRGVLDMHQKNSEAGLKRIQKALQYDPYCVLALETMAQYYSQNADVNHLVEYYGKAMEAAKSKSELCRLITMRETVLTQLQIAEDFCVTSG